MDVKSEILKLKEKKDVLILSHYYQYPEVQDIADFVGDSFQLSVQATKSNKKIIVFAGVYFMAETVKILNPLKKVLIPDVEAGCSLVDDVMHKKIIEFKVKNPDYTIVCYINSSAEVKAVSDLVCTSSNAVKIINSIPEERKILFVPDKNLGKYLGKVTNRKIDTWDSSCIVHEKFSFEEILMLKRRYKNAKVVAHPECKESILNVSDFVGSTSALLDYVTKDNSTEYIVATESGIIYQMKKANPKKLFIIAPTEDSTYNSGECKYMKMITLEKILNSLKYERYEVNVPVEIMEKAKLPLMKMLEISK